MSAPTVINDLPTLGHPVRLGELYDANSKQFLGIQLFSKATIDKGQLPLGRLEDPLVKLSVANSFKDRHNVINISAELSISVLSGLVTVQGSGTYLNETKSNNTDSAWAMHVTVQKSKHTLDLTENALNDDNALKWTRDHYIDEGVATHFVSSIVYGGSVIAQFVARSSKLDDDEQLKGKLRLKLNHLAGVVSVDGEVKAEAKQQAEEMKDYFDVTLHGDMDLQTVPVDAEGVVKVFSNATTLIGDGIPVSVTLQPISDKLRKADTVVYHLNETLLNELLDIFDKLDTINSRFDVLQNATRTDQDFIPALATQVNRVFIKFSSDHRSLVTRLGTLIHYLQSHSYTPSQDEVNLKKDARSLFEKHTPVDKDYYAPKYPDSLAGLEKAYQDFQDFVHYLKGKNAGKDGGKDKQVDAVPNLNVLQDVIKATTIESAIGLALMPPLASSSFQNNTLFANLLRAAIKFYPKGNPPIFSLYLEDSTMLGDLPSNDSIPNIHQQPSFIIGKKTDDSTRISWEHVEFEDLKMPKKLYDFNIGLNSVALDQAREIEYFMLRKLFKTLDSKKSFTIIARAKSINSPASLNDGQPDAKGPILLSVISPDTEIDFQNRDYVADILVTQGNANMAQVSMAQGYSPTRRSRGVVFSTTFVQDVSSGVWRFYVDGELTGKPLPIPSSPTWGQPIEIDVQGGNWGGWLYGVQVYQAALTPAEIKRASRLKANPGQL